jgi:hypothetical protein
MQLAEQFDGVRRPTVARLRLDESRGPAHVRRHPASQLGMIHGGAGAESGFVERRGLASGQESPTE